MADKEAGVPSWADLATPDLDASISYYSSLFGWDARRTDDATAGTYCLFSIGGKAVAGAGPLTMRGQPPAWATYVRVDDADASAAAFREAGGRTLVPPMEVMDQGRLAIVADPGGAVLGLWQPRAFAGAAVFNEPGALCWNELATRNLEGAATFYGQTLGWKGETNDAGYTQWMLNGHPVGGMVRMTEEWPAEMPANWMVYFAVEEVEDAASRASELGGTVMVPPTDSPVGPFSVIRDPHGAGFSIIRPGRPA